MHIAIKGDKVDISSEKKLEEFTKKFSSHLKKGDIYFLFGEVGVGKTTFVKYLIHNLQSRYNKKKTEVTSPTFNIMHEYEIDNLLIKHYDLYRLKSSSELKDLNLIENNSKDILFIEWPQIIKKKPPSVIELYFEYENEYKDRIIKF